MFLTEANVLHYLLERRFADLESVAGGDYRVRNLTRRNRNFHVTCGAREYLVKQPKKWNRKSRRSLEREAAVYWQTKIDPGFQPIKALAPESYGYDPAQSILILEYLTEQSNLHRRRDRFAPHVARLAGAAMGAFHRDMRTVSRPAVLPTFKPWCLSAHDAGPDELEDQTEGQRELLRVVQKHSDFGRALGSLREEWREETAIHGDWKLENCLVSPAGERIHAIDWEFANWGDPFWDIGTMLQSWWNLWVCRSSACRIEEVQPALKAFLEGYASEDRRDPVEMTARALRFAAARMLQTAYEWLDDADKMNAAAVRLSQASLNIFTRPEWALEQLFGADWN
jgi:hypothetical protein